MLNLAVQQFIRVRWSQIFSLSFCFIQCTDQIYYAWSRFM